MSKQHHTRFLPETQSEAARRERWLQYAFLNSTSAVGRRPERVKSRFDNAARESNPSRPWECFAESLRAVAQDAAEIGGPTVEATEDLIIDVVIAFMDYVMEPMKVPQGECGYLSLNKELPEGVEAITAAKLDPTPENLANADVQVAEAARALQLYRGGLRRTHQYMRPRGATPTIGLV